MGYPSGYARSRREPLLLKDLGDVVFDGALGDGKLLGYLGIDQPSPEEDGYLLFAVGDPFGRFVGRW